MIVLKQEFWCTHVVPSNYRWGKTFPPMRRPAWHGNAILKWGGEDVWNE